MEDPLIYCVNKAAVFVLSDTLLPYFNFLYI